VRFHIDRFSAGLDDLTVRQQADHVEVIRVLHRTGRFSCFEASANQTIASTVTKLLHNQLKGYGVLLKRTGGEYPWTEVALTQSGLNLLGSA
jgi:hypothetical protein